MNLKLKWLPSWISLLQKNLNWQFRLKKEQHCPCNRFYSTEVSSPKFLPTTMAAALFGVCFVERSIFVPMFEYVCNQTAIWRPRRTCIVHTMGSEEYVLHVFLACHNCLWLINLNHLHGKRTLQQTESPAADDKHDQSSNQKIQKIGYHGVQDCRMQNVLIGANRRHEPVPSEVESNHRLQCPENANLADVK